MTKYKYYPGAINYCTTAAIENFEYPASTMAVVTSPTIDAEYSVVKDEDRATVQGQKILDDLRAEISRNSYNGL